MHSQHVHAPAPGMSRLVPAWVSPEEQHHAWHTAQSANTCSRLCAPGPAHQTRALLLLKVVYGK